MRSHDSGARAIVGHFHDCVELTGERVDDAGAEADLCLCMVARQSAAVIDYGERPARWTGGKYYLDMALHLLCIGEGVLERIDHKFGYDQAPLTDWSGLITRSSATTSRVSRAGSVIIDAPMLAHRSNR